MTRNWGREHEEPKKEEAEKPKERIPESDGDSKPFTPDIPSKANTKSEPRTVHKKRKKMDKSEVKKTDGSVNISDDKKNTDETIEKIKSVLNS